MPRQPRMFWLCRDPNLFDNPNPSYELHESKPEGRTTEQGWFWRTSTRIESFCPKEFERITRFKMKPGECKRVRIHIEEVK